MKQWIKQVINKKLKTVKLKLNGINSCPFYNLTLIDITHGFSKIHKVIKVTLFIKSEDVSKIQQRKLYGMRETKQCEEIPTLNVLTVIYKL